MQKQTDASQDPEAQSVVTGGLQEGPDLETMSHLHFSFQNCFGPACHTQVLRVDLRRV